MSEPSKLRMNERRVAREPASTAAAYVLAGGGSKRFGQDKALVEFAGKPMLERMLGTVMDASSHAATVVGGAEKYGRFGVTCVEDRWPGQGPLGGIITAVQHTKKEWADCEWNLVVSCDMPFLNAEWLRFLMERAQRSEAQVVLAHSKQGPEPLCACWRTDTAKTLQGAFERGVRKVTDAIALLRAEVLDERDWGSFDSAGRLFWNMNTPAEYKEARRILEAQKA